MVRCRWSGFLKITALCACVLMVCLWWRLYLFPEHSTSDLGIPGRIILTRENAPFFNVGRRFHPKVAAGQHDTRGNLSNKHEQKDSHRRHLDNPINESDGYPMNNDNINNNLHAFYYAWYGSPGQDGKYLHWNHRYLPHWNDKVSAKFPTGKLHVPPDDISSSFYPLLGPYSSADESVTRSHMIQMQRAGIGVLSLSWYPPGMADEEGAPIEYYIPTIFDIADQYNIKVCFHLEPYKSRNTTSIKENLKYIMETYGDHPAFYTHQKQSGLKKLPLVYVYDSYLIEENEWRKLLTNEGEISIRETDHDALIIGLLVEKKHLTSLHRSGFDGMYTYFAASGFSYGSDRSNWNNIGQTAKLNNLMFIPSVGPGYDDLKIRPWNGVNSRSRDAGSYYEEGWKMALSAPGISIVSITSFNEWHEGTQIESASSISKYGVYSYLTYEPSYPEYYLDATKIWSLKLQKYMAKSW